MGDGHLGGYKQFLIGLHEQDLEEHKELKGMNLEEKLEQLERDFELNKDSASANEIHDMETEILRCKELLDRFNQLTEEYFKVSE
jgi:hypothetical protein